MTTREEMELNAKIAADLPDMREELTDKDGDNLLKLARDAVELGVLGEELSSCTYAGVSIEEQEEEISRSYMEDARHPNMANFVTVYRGEKVHACFGSLFPSLPLVRSIKENAYNAALSDGRYLHEAELPYITIEIDIPSPLHVVLANSVEERLAQIEMYTHGVGIEDARGDISTFLPKVWCDYRLKENFLDDLCEGAGLDRSAWQDLERSVVTYETRVFRKKEENQN